MNLQNKNQTIVDGTKTQRSFSLNSSDYSFNNSPYFLISKIIDIVPHFLWAFVLWHYASVGENLMNKVLSEIGKSRNDMNTLLTEARADKQQMFEMLTKLLTTMTEVHEKLLHYLNNSNVHSIGHGIKKGGLQYVGKSPEGTDLYTLVSSDVSWIQYFYSFVTPTTVGVVIGVVVLGYGGYQLYNGSTWLTGKLVAGYTYIGSQWAETKTSLTNQVDALTQSIKGPIAGIRAAIESAPRDMMDYCDGLKDSVVAEIQHIKALAVSQIKELKDSTFKPLFDLFETTQNLLKKIEGLLGGSRPGELPGYIPPSDRVAQAAADALSSAASAGVTGTRVARDIAADAAAESEATGVVNRLTTPNTTAAENFALRCLGESDASGSGASGSGASGSGAIGAGPSSSNTFENLPSSPGAGTDQFSSASSVLESNELMSEIYVILEPIFRLFFV